MVANYRKFLVALIGAGLTVISQLYGNAEWVQVAVSLATAAGVYGVPNKSR